MMCATLSKLPSLDLDCIQETYYRVFFRERIGEIVSACVYVCVHAHAGVHVCVCFFVHGFVIVYLGHVFSKEKLLRSVRCKGTTYHQLFSVIACSLAF